MRLSNVNCQNFMDYMTQGHFEKEKERKDKGELVTFLGRVKDIAERHARDYDRENGDSSYRQDCAVLSGKTPLQSIMRELKKFKPPLKRGPHFNQLSYDPEKIKLRSQRGQNHDDTKSTTMTK